jgi:hypothetical protein
MNFLKEVFGAIAYFLFPPRCPICKEIVDEHYQICQTCAGKILRLDFSSEVPPTIKSVLRVARYREGLQPLLHKLKFDNNLKNPARAKKNPRRRIKPRGNVKVSA